MGLCTQVNHKPVTNPYRGKHLIKHIVTMIKMLDFLSDLEITKLQLLNRLFYKNVI
jgi:hypothetical protein